MKDKAKWLLDQLPGWTDGGQMSAAIAESIREQFLDVVSPTSALSRNAVLILTAACMVGIGIIMLVSWNWNDLTRLARIVLAFVPWLLSSSLLVWALLSGRAALHRAWVEGAAALQNLCNGASLAMIALLYPSGGTLSGLLLLWLLLQLPFVWLTRSYASVLIYLVVAFSYLGSSEQYSSSTGLYWLLLAAVAPLVWLMCARQSTRHAAVLLWAFAAVILIGFFIEFAYSSTIINQTILSLLLVVYLAAGRVFLPRHREASRSSLFYRPFECIGYVGVLLMALIFTKDHSWVSYGFASEISLRSADIFALTVLVLAWGYLTSRLLTTKDDPPVPFLAFPVVFLTAYLLINPLEKIVASWSMNIYMIFGIALWLIVIGWRNQNLPKLNMGILIILSLTIFHYFVRNLGILPTAITFICTGAILLWLNWWLSKKPSNT